MLRSKHQNLIIFFWLFEKEISRKFGTGLLADYFHCMGLLHRFYWYDILNFSLKFCYLRTRNGQNRSAEISCFLLKGRLLNLTTKIICKRLFTSLTENNINFHVTSVCCNWTLSFFMLLISFWFNRRKYLKCPCFSSFEWLQPMKKEIR